MWGALNATGDGCTLRDLSYLIDTGCALGTQMILNAAEFEALLGDPVELSTHPFSLCCVQTFL